MNSNQKFSWHNSAAGLVSIAGIVTIADSFSATAVLIIPKCEVHEGWVRVIVLILILLLLTFLSYLNKDEKKRDQDKMTENELCNQAIKRATFITSVDKWLKRYPKNIMTLKFIPISICNLIEFFITRKNPILKNKYNMHSFSIPSYWPDYTTLKKQYFKPMLRIYVKSLDVNYEIKFNRDCKTIGLRETNKKEIQYKDLQEIEYKKLQEHIKTFTKITPFGLFWNIRRLFCITTGKFDKKVKKGTT